MAQQAQRLHTLGLHEAILSVHLFAKGDPGGRFAFRLAAIEVIQHGLLPLVGLGATAVARLQADALDGPSRLGTEVVGDGGSNFGAHCHGHGGAALVHGLFQLRLELADELFRQGAGLLLGTWRRLVRRQHGTGGDQRGGGKNQSHRLPHLWCSLSIVYASVALAA